MKLKAKFNNDEILLATILDAIAKIDLDKALSGKDLQFIENVYAVIEDFCICFGETVESSAIDLSHNIPTY